MYAKLFGKLLGYPECCIEHFVNNRLAGSEDVSYSGYRPCPACVEKYPTRAAIEKALGRNLAEPPPEYVEFVDTTRFGKAAGLRIYASNPKFFLECWKFAFGKKA